MGKIQSNSDESIISGLTGSGVTADNAIRSLYREYFETLSHYVINNSGNEDDAQDIFQDVIIAFVNLVRAGKFRGESSIKTFLYSLNRNMWLNELKKRSRAVKRESRYEEMTLKPEATIQQAIEYQQASKELIKVLEQLGPNCKKILLLFYYENQSIKEILESLDYENEQVVRNKKYKCLKQMEQLVYSNTYLQSQLKTMLHG